MSKRDRKPGKRKGPTPRKRTLWRWLVRCEGCGHVQRNTKAHPPPVFPMPPKPLLALSRFEEPSDWVASCAKCPSVTGVFVKVPA